MFDYRVSVGVNEVIFRVAGLDCVSTKDVRGKEAGREENTVSSIT